MVVWRLYHNFYPQFDISYIRMLVDILDNTSQYGMKQHHLHITQQSNGVGVRFVHGDDGVGAFN